MSNQRWSEGRASYRPAGETIRTADYEIAEITGDNESRAFIETHHYSRTYPAARFRVGLYRHGELAGVAVFSHPCSNKVLTNVFKGPVLSSVELGRFVLLDSVAGNGETWFLARSFEILRSRGITGVVSFSDPVRRTDAQGNVLLAGHVGTIYQAHNGVYLGRGTARTLQVMPDGRVFSDRAAQKIRKGERGWRYAAAQIEALGVETAPEDPADRTVWLNAALKQYARPLRHHGNHKYAWALDRKVRKQLPVALPYPKQVDLAV